MKLPKGTQLKAKHDFANNWKKDQVVEVSKIIKKEDGKKEYLIDGVAAFSKKIILKNFDIFTDKETPNKKDKPKKEKIKLEKKRVIFPWMKTYQGRCYKCMLAFLADKKGWDKVITGDVNFNKRLNTIIEETNSYFPDMYKIVAKHYEDNGRVLPLKEFIPIVIGRLTFMFKFDRQERKIIRLREHPQECGDKFKDALKTCQQLVESKTKYDDKIHNKG